MWSARSGHWQSPKWQKNWSLSHWSMSIIQLIKWLINARSSIKESSNTWWVARRRTETEAQTEGLLRTRAIPPRAQSKVKKERSSTSWGQQAPTSTLVLCNPCIDPCDGWMVRHMWDFLVFEWVLQFSHPSTPQYCSFSSDSLMNDRVILLKQHHFCNK